MESLLKRLENNLQPLLQGTRRFCLAYSGGVDSHVLLHALVSLRQANRFSIPIHAFHVNHGLSPNAAQWSAHCRSICLALDIPIQVLIVDARACGGESPEAKAREARYAALSSATMTGDVWLTAHHQDDQAETFLLQLLRGAGVEGLSAMPIVQPFSSGRLVRPLLDINRQTIQDYAQAEQLQWVEDESNQQHHFDRNFLRHEVMPLLKQRWPSAAKTITRAATHCATAARLLNRDADELVSTVQGSSADRLSVLGLQQLSSEQQALLLRHWIHRLGFPRPSAVHIQQIQLTVLGAQWDTSPLLHWRGAEIRRYRDELFLLAPQLAHDATRKWIWDLQTDLDMESSGRLALKVAAAGQGFSVTRLREQGAIEVRFRLGGERFRQRGRDTHSLKKLMQEWGIPPWQRDRIPLLYAADQLVSVAGYAVSEDHQAVSDELGYGLVWCPAQAPMLDSSSFLTDDNNT